jgi:hypothetical protein
MYNIYTVLNTPARRELRKKKKLFVVLGSRIQEHPLPDDGCG